MTAPVQWPTERKGKTLPDLRFASTHDRSDRQYGRPLDERTSVVGFSHRSVPKTRARDRHRTLGEVHEIRN